MVWRLTNGLHGDHVVRLVRLDCVGLLVALSALAFDERELAYVGASAIEDLIQAHPGDLTRFEEAARSNYSFRQALRCAWFENFLTPAEAERLRSFGESF
jgi:hypothetical protein